MKNLFGFILFLGAFTTCSAQTGQPVIYPGVASVEKPQPNVLYIWCGPSTSKVCYSVAPIMGGENKYRLIVPDKNIDVVASPMSTVNGTPFDQLTGNEGSNTNDGSTNNYQIELFELDNNNE